LKWWCAYLYRYSYRCDNTRTRHSTSIAKVVAIGSAERHEQQQYQSVLQELAFTAVVHCNSLSVHAWWLSITAQAPDGLSLQLPLAEVGGSSNG
jgi:hypothetical protein